MFTTPVDPAVEIAARSPVTTRPLRIALLAVVLLVLAATTWAVLGRAPRTVDGAGILEPDGGYLEIGTPTTGVVTSVAVSPGDRVVAGQLVAVVAAGRPATEEPVFAPQAGVIAELVARPGRATRPGDPLAYLAPSGTGLAMSAFVPARLATGLQPGMPAHVEVAAAPAAQYGFIDGRVTSVAPTPATPDALLYTLRGNTELVEFFSGSGPVVQVTVALQQADTPSGFRWTIGSGPDLPITFGTLADVRVVTDRGPVIGWLTN